MSEEVTPQRGRPKLDDPRENIVRVRLSNSELKNVEAAAEAAGVKPAEWARGKILAAAKRARPKTQEETD